MTIYEQEKQQFETMKGIFIKAFTVFMEEVDCKEEYLEDYRLVVNYFDEQIRRDESLIEYEKRQAEKENGDTI